MRWLLIVTVCAWQAVRGLGEAITMHYPGPREHPLFDWYHQIRLVEYAMLCVACYCVFDGSLRIRQIATRCTQLWGIRHNWSTVKDCLTLAGVSVVSWELFELSYLWGRVGQAAWHENIMGLWSFDGFGVLYIHAARAIIGIALIWKGGQK